MQTFRPSHFKITKCAWAVFILFLSSTPYAASSLAARAVAAGVPAALNPYGLEPGLIGRSLDPGLMGNALAKQPSAVTPEQAAATPTSSQLNNEAASKITLLLKKVTISGNHAIKTTQIQAIFKPYLNHTITLAQLMSLVDSVTNLYQKSGYFLSKAFLPPQEIRDGGVDVTVVEGFISKIDIEGVTGRKQEMLAHYGNRIKAVKPIELTALERNLLLMNDIPGFQSKSFIAPDPKTPLGSTLTLKTDFTPANAYYSHDNFQTLYLGPQENTLHATINSPLIPGGTTNISSITADKAPKLQYYEIRQDQLIGSSGLNITADMYYTRTNPGFILAPLNIIGYSGDGNANISYPLIRGKQRNLSLQGQFNYMDSHSTALSQLLYEDWIRDFSLTATYEDIIWKGEDTATLILDKGFNILGAHDNRGVIHSHIDGSSDFFRFDYTLTRTQYLNNMFSLYGLISGQYASRPVLAADDFIFGGPYLGRGYDIAQFTGDEGVAGSIEFRGNLAGKLPFMDKTAPFLQDLQGYVFYDVARLRNFIEGNRAIITSGASAGVGLRTTVFPHFKASGFLGKPLTTPNATQVILRQNGHAFLGYFQITAYI